MLQRLPRPQAIVQVYAVIVVLLAGWTITAFLWKVSAWLLLLNLGEILTLFAYAMLSNLLESLLILLLILTISLLFPTLRAHFVVRGTILAFGLIGAMMAFVGLHMQFGMDIGAGLLLGPIVVLAITAGLLNLSSASRFVDAVHSAILRLTDRLIIFLYILLPLFFISTVYLILRSLV